ncbi:MAG: indolepyruvate ferredoxin oxidoreductase subunit alpha [Synergistaceae bacterium]|nr:indolepyruvate ferredoxin oxidoreductase subunit alpha [Synergistaceae bacterium]
MAKRVCMGNEAIALGALAAGIKVAAGYPGTPSTEIIETLVAVRQPDVKVQWSTNEKVALEVAAGAAYAGARSLCTMKQVGLNVASDPLMSLSYIGVKGGMVIAVADDPGPWSSQTEQDTRGFAKHANLPVFDPSSPEEAYEMIQAAYELSEAFALPVFLRPTTRVCHASAEVELREPRPAREAEGFEKRPEWCIFPALSYRRHGELEVKQRELARRFDAMPFNRIEGGEGCKKGVAVSGVSYLYAKELIGELGLDVRLYKIGTPYPLPEGLTREFLDSVDSVLVIEELDPVVEEQLLIAAEGKRPVLGKRSGDMPWNGEYSYELIKQALLKYLALPCEEAEAEAEELPPLPLRPPVLCAGCPHRASFYEAKIATKDCAKAIYCGDIGCYTLGNAAPLNMVDTCLCMGAGITIAQGLALAEPGTKCLAFVGDSTFFHTGIPGIINAVYQGTDITVIVLDNRTTAMTGHQPHPGTGRRALGDEAPALDIETILRGCGVRHIAKVNPFDYEKAVAAMKEAVAFPGPSAVIAEAPCIAHIKKPSTAHFVDDNCIKCGRCIREIGCPAITPDETGRAVINGSLCTDCALCANLCPVSAIKRGEING